MEVNKELGRELSDRFVGLSSGSGKDTMSVPAWKFGFKSSSPVQPEDNNNEAGITELRMQSLDNKAASPNDNLVRKTKSFNDSFLVNIDDLFDNVSAGSFDKTGNTAMCQSSSTPKEDSDFRKLSKLQIEPTLPIALRFQDVKYKVYAEKYILHGITGSAHPGEVLALMGPSGCGKTTLLNLLSGRVKFNSGAITYNDQPYNKSLNRRSQNTVIGGKFVRGISGGERKRVCIGHEILLNPSLLLLDEPTSGLDSTTALRIVQILQDMAKAGKTVVTTIHQPSSRLFTMNPAEFLIDLANGNINDKSVPSELEDKFVPGNRKLETIKEGLSPTDVHEYLLEAYEAKVGTMEKEKSRQPVVIEGEIEIHGKLSPREWGATWWDQLILVRRSFKERRHDT
ncbi:hypothetical protein GH714_021050 [Hevea brasiliensis]|uniref:ABC transporter domain-containing protein n=1 Tax=Hevea brasiliensis TaxID=3981 RepID=A0A6A6KRK8_HEVBR|nr:hypothetical protein GH714_021050 [Hevea brasiliensis]